MEGWRFEWFKFEHSKTINDGYKITCLKDPTIMAWAVNGDNYRLTNNWPAGVFDKLTPRVAQAYKKALSELIVDE